MGSNIRITERDMELLKFLAEYKIMLLDNARYIYDTITYQEKRIVKLVRHGYVKRLKHRYVTLGMEGIGLLIYSGVEIRQHCRNANNMERLKIISDIAAALSFTADTNFIPSWQLKKDDKPTNHSRRYIGITNFDDKLRMVYAIYEGKTKRYLTSINYDMKREYDYDHFIIFTNNLEQFLFMKRPYYPQTRHIRLILYNDFSKAIIRNYEKIKIMIQIHFEKEYEIEPFYDEEGKESFDFIMDYTIYAKLMLFIEIDELNRLDRYFEPGWKHTKDVIIICLEENLELLKKYKPNHKFITISRDKIKEFIEQDYPSDMEWI